MSQLVNLARRSLLHDLSITAFALRNKKKDAAAAAGPQRADSPDIVNIFKERKDPEFLPTQEYPSWLYDIHPTRQPLRSKAHLMYNAWIRDFECEKIRGSDTRRMLKRLRRAQVKECNFARLVKKPEADAAWEDRDDYSDVKELKEEDYLEMARQAEELEREWEGDEGEEEEEKKPAASASAGKGGKGDKASPAPAGGKADAGKAGKKK